MQDASLPLNVTRRGARRKRFAFVSECRRTQKPFDNWILPMLAKRTTNFTGGEGHAVAHAVPKNLADTATLDLTALGLVPRFSIEGR